MKKSETGTPALQAVLTPGMRVLDLGCGAGWFANALARHEDVSVTALDFNPVAVDRARQVGGLLGLDVEYVVGDLFAYTPDRPFDIVVSMGVLHPHETQHTQKEMRLLLEEEGMVLEASSINRFQPFADPAELDGLEPDYERLATDYLQRETYFPGFFLFLAGRRA